jgi:hypothetical protein
MFFIFAVLFSSINGQSCCFFSLYIDKIRHLSLRVFGAGNHSCLKPFRTPFKLFTLLFLMLFLCLCRLSLIHKSAAEKTWSLAPSLHLKVNIPNPYNSILCYTSLHLREVSLVSRLDYLSLLTHLRDHCPNLRSLSITTDLLMNFSRFDDILSSVLERLSELKVHQQGAKSDGTRRLLAVLSRCQRAPAIEHLDLRWTTTNLAALKAILAKLPSLKTFRMPLNRDNIDFVDLFAGCESLETVGGLKTSKKPFHVFCRDWVAATSLSSKLGLNLCFIGISRVEGTQDAELSQFLNEEKEISALVLLRFVRRQAATPLQIFDDLAAAGLKQAFKMEYLIDFLSACVVCDRPEPLKELLRWMLSPASAAFLHHIFKTQFPCGTLSSASIQHQKLRS